MPLLRTFPLVAALSSATLSTDVFKALFMGALLHICSWDPGPGCPGRKARDLGLPHDILPNVPRAAVGPCNIPLYNYEQCGNQLRDQFNRGIKIQTSLPANNGKSTIALLITNYALAQFNNVPPACMNLVVALSGSCTGSGARPVPCGSACIQYQGLTAEEKRRLSSWIS